MTFLLQADETAVNIADSLRYSTEKVIGALKEDPSAFMTELASQALHFAVKVIAALVIYLIGIWVIRSIKHALSRHFQRKSTDRTVASFVSSLVSISLTVLLIMLTISALGVNTTSLAAVLAAGGMAVGMALSGTVQNFAGGLMILVFKPFKVGDFISAMNCSGTVTEVSMVSTKICTVDNRIISIPNGDLSSNTVDNYSVNPLRRVDWTVNVEYGSDSDLCRKLLLEIVKSDERVLNAETEGAADPVVYLSGLNDSCISFSLRVWTEAGNYWNLYFDVNQAIYNKLPKAGVQFAYPHMDVSISPKLNNTDK